MKIATLRANKIKQFKVRYVRKQQHSHATHSNKRQPHIITSWKVSLLRRGNKFDYEHVGTFQEAIAPVLILAQVFALMPVKGISKRRANEIEFSWRCYRTLYALLVLCCFGLCSILTIIHACRDRFNFNSIETIIFYTSIFVIAASFLNLARKWPALMREWEQVELQLPKLHTQIQKTALAQRIKMITLVACMCSLLEHLLSMLSKIYYVNRCPAIRNQPIDSFLFDSFSQYFYFFEYNTFMGVFGKILNVLSTFAWNFNDMFVMVISVALAARFRQLNEYMVSIVKHTATTTTTTTLTTTEKVWMRNRINYRNLCKLCNTVDDAISLITLVCFSNNLYFICGKILKSIQKKPSVSHTLYFWFSLIFLIGRTFVLSQYASSINDEAKRPLRIFCYIRHDSWCPELKRFSEEVATDAVALSGMKFFQLTRGLLLSVGGTIVTYELVLLQFSKDQEIGDCLSIN